MEAATVDKASLPAKGDSDEDTGGTHCAAVLTLSGMSRDEAELAAMGYKAQLMRGFNGFMSFAFCFTAVAVLSSLSISMGGCILYTGGPTVMVYGWIICSVFTVIVSTAMAEICSSYPSAGSVYHWTGQLAPEQYSRVVSYICGWFNFMGNVAGDAAFGYGFANFVVASQTIRNCPVNVPEMFEYAGWRAAQGLPMVDTSSSSSSSASGAPPFPSLPPVDCKVYGVGTQVGIGIAVCACWAALNIMRVDAQGWLNNFAVSWQVATTVAIVATVLASGRNHQLESSYFVWNIWRNRTGLPDNEYNSRWGYIVLVGLSSSLYSFSGYEAGAHLSEETRNASKNSAWGLVATCVTTALVGLLYILGLLYAIPREVGLYSTLTAYSGFPVPSLFSVATGNKAGEILTNVIVANLFFAGMSSFTVTTRIGWAMARDGAFPFSDKLSGVSARTQSPTQMVILVFVIDALLLLLPLSTIKLSAEYGPIAFNAVTSITVIGYQISYCIPIFLRAVCHGQDFVRSEFNLGRAGLPVAHVAWMWLLVTSMFLFWPSSFPVNKNNMNYTVVPVFGFMFVAAAYWFLGNGRATYRGPKRVAPHRFQDMVLEKMRGEAEVAPI